MLTIQTHKLFDPETFQGAVAVAVVSGLALALIFATVRWVRRRHTAATLAPADAHGASATRRDLTDLVTGIGQAAMAVREALELFGRAVLVDPDTGELEENSRDVLVEAHRTVDEAEARLPRVELWLRRSRRRRQASS